MLSYCADIFHAKMLSLEEQTRVARPDHRQAATCALISRSAKTTVGVKLEDA